MGCKMKFAKFLKYTGYASQFAQSRAWTVKATSYADHA